MPFPKLTNGRVDPQVSNILMAFTNQDFIADQILPTVPNLAEESGKIPSIGQSHLRVYKSKRALYDETGHRIEFTISNSDSYNIEYYDLEIYAPDRLAGQLQKPFDVRRDSGLTLLQSMMLEREDALATMMTSTAVITNNVTLSGESQYSDHVNSDPVGDIQTACDSVFNNSLMEATDIMIQRDVFNELKQHPAFLNYFHGSAKVLTSDMLKQALMAMFDFKRVHIGKARKISSRPGQTVTKTNVWGKDIVVFARPDVPSLLVPSFGYSFSLAGQNRRFSTRRHPNDFGDINRLELAYDDLILQTEAAYLIKSALS